MAKKKKNKNNNKEKCLVCGQTLNTSAGKASHYRKHVRDGLLEEKLEGNNPVWITKEGETIKIASDKPKEEFVWKSHHAFRSHKPRIPSVAKSSKNGDIQIKCRKCNEWRSAMETKLIDGKNKKVVMEFADNRFFCIRHCDTATLFPKRMLKTLLSRPGKELVE